MSERSKKVKEYDSYYRAAGFKTADQVAREEREYRTSRLKRMQEEERLANTPAQQYAQDRMYTSNNRRRLAQRTELDNAINNKSAAEEYKKKYNLSDEGFNKDAEYRRNEINTQFEEAKSKPGANAAQLYASTYGKRDYGKDYRKGMMPTPAETESSLKPTAPANKYGKVVTENPDNVPTYTKQGVKVKEKEREKREVREATKLYANLSEDDRKDLSIIDDEGDFVDRLIRSFGHYNDEPGSDEFVNDELARGSKSDAAVSRLKSRGYTDSQIKAMSILYRQEQNKKFNDETYMPAVEKFAEEHPVGASVASVAMKPIMAPAGMAGKAQEKMNARYNDYMGRGVDSNNPLIAMAAADNDIRQKVIETQDMSKLGSEAYMMGMSTADTLVNMAMGMMFGGALVDLGVGGNVGAKLAAKYPWYGSVGSTLSKLGLSKFNPISGSIFGLSAQADALRNPNERLAAKDQLSTATAAMVFETLCESVSIGNLDFFDADVPAKTIGQLLTQIFVKNGIPNGTEEAITNLSNKIYDAVHNKENSEYNILIEDYLANNPGATEKEARRYALSQMGVDILRDFIGGYIQGAALGGVKGAVNFGRQNISYGREGKQFRLGDDYSEGAIASTLVQNGYGKQTSASLAKAITDAATGKQMSQRVQNTINSSEFLTEILNETRAAVAENTETFREAAEDIGIKSPKDTNRSVARAIDLSLAKTAEDNQVSRSDLYKEFREQGVGKIQSAIEARKAQSIDRKLGKESLTNAEREAYEKESTRQALENAQSRRFAENENEIAAKQRIINTVKGTSDIKNNVSSTGRVTVKGTDSKVKNYKITDVAHDIKILTDKNGKKSSQNVTNIGVEVTFADGTTKTVSSDDIYFASTEEARAMDVIDSVCQRTDIDTETANFLLASLPSVLGNTSTEAAVVAIKTAYDSGKYDLPLGMYGEASVGVLGVNMFNAIRQSGASVSLGNTQAADEAVKKAIRAFVTNPSESVKGTVMFRGKQINSEMIDNDKSLSDAQKDALRTQMIIADVTGIKIVADESTEATRATTENGWFAYDKGEGGYVIHADMNSGTDGQGAVLFTMAHELTHFIKTWSPTQFDNLANFALNHLGEDFDIETSIKAQQDAAARAGEKLSRAAAYEEVICNAMQTMLSDDKKTVVSRLAELNKENPELFNKLQSEINRIGDAAAKKHKELENDRGAISNIGRAMAQVEDSIGELRSMFAEALQEAGKNFKAAGGAELNAAEKAVVGEFKKLGKLEVDKSGDLILATNENDSTAMYSYRTWDENGRDQLISLLESKGHTQEEIDKVISQIEDAADYLKILAAGDAKNAGYDALADHLMADIVTDVASGKQIVSALVPNGDYPVNIDLALICKKRVAYMKLLNYLVDEGVLEDVKFGGEAIADVNKILRDSGFETACLGCFVESRRLQIQTWAETIAQEWNAAVDNVRKNAPYFGFADKEGAANLTDDEIASLEGWLNQQEQNDKGNVKMRGRTVADKMVNLLQDLKDSGDTKALNTLARKITVGDLITPQGLTKLRSVSGELFSLVKSRYGAASPKIVQDFNPYNSEIAMMTFQAVKNITGKSISGSKSYLSAAEAELADSKPPKKDKAGLEKWNADVQNLALQKYFKDIGGIRIQSFSDFMIENVFDYLQIVADLSARDFTMHGYTKEATALRLFGMTGIKWNGSLIAHVDPKMGKEYAGLMPASEAKAHRGILVKVDGKEYSIGFDDFERHSKFDKNSFIQSIGYKDIVALQCDKRYSPYVGSICIGVSDKQIQAMLDCDLIRMVIPYHASGMLPEFAKLVGVDMYTDYTLSQNTKFASVRGLNGEDVKLKIDKVTKQQKAQLVVGKKDGKDVYAGSKQIEHFAFNAKVQELGDAKAAADAYLAWCKEEHPIFNSEGDLVGYGTYEPKFSQFSNHKNYYKLLEDFNSYDSVTGASAVQDAVKMNLPSKENKLTAKELAEYKQALKKTGLFSDSEIEKYAKKAQMSFQEIVKESVDERIAYGKMTEPIKQETFEKVKDLLLEKHNRNGKRAASMKDYKKAQERKSTKNAVMPLEGAYGDKKYSRRAEETDQEYFDAIEKYGEDSKQVEDMVERAAKEAGYTIKAWHGTRYSFNEFLKDKRGSNTHTKISQNWFFAADKETANSYYPYGVLEYLFNKTGNNSYNPNKIKPDRKGNLYSLYLKMDNPLIVDVKDYDYAAHRDNEDAWMEYVKQAEEVGNDGIILLNALDNQLKTGARESTVYMFRDSSQAKSADPVTYDDSGNIIPLSERFNSENEDIRYSRRTADDTSESLEDILNNASDEQVKSIVDAVDKELLGDAMYYGRMLSEQKKKTQQKVKEQRKKDVAYYQQRMKEIREDRDQKILALKALRYQRDVERREFAARRDYRAKILRKYDRLQKMTTNPTEKQHVPAELMNSIAGFLGEITPNLLQEQTRKDGTVIKKREQNNNRLMDLVAAYKAIQRDYEDVYDKDVAELLQEASEAFGSKYLEDMDSDELADVNNLMSAIEHTIRRANKAFVEGKERDAFALARNLVRQSNEGKQRQSNFAKRIIWSQLNPYSVFHAMSNYEDGGWMDMYKILNEGQLRKTRIQTDVVAAFKELMDNQELDKLSDYKNGLVDVGLVGKNNQPIKITRGMMLALYLHLQNEQNRKHVAEGGLTIPELEKYYKGNTEAWGNEKIRTLAINGDLYRLHTEQDRLRELKKNSNSDEIKARYDNDIAEIQSQIEELRGDADRLMDDISVRIESQLTEYERKFLDKAKWFFNEYSKDKLNEATMQMYGFKKAREENYMPIISDKNFLAAEFDAVKRDASLENMGFMKERQAGANNAIMLFDLTDVINAQLNKVSKYAGLAPATKEFQRVYNKAFFDDKGEKLTVQDAAEMRFGTYGKDYIGNLLADLQGGRKAKGSTGIFGHLRGASYQAALMLNLRVAMAQAGSYPTAAAEVGWKPLMKALAKGGKNESVISRADRELIDTYTPLLANRFVGGAKTDITNIKKNSKHTLGGLESRALQHTRAATDWISIVDTATVGRLWSAAEYYVDENFDLEKGSEGEIKSGESEYYKKVAEVFNRIVERTQPSYTTMQRSALLRDPNEALKLFTMFMTQRAQNFNLVYDAAATFAAEAEKKKSGSYDAKTYDEARRTLGRVAVSQAIAGVTLASMKALADAIQHNMKGYKDDDDEITLLSFLEKLGKTFVESEVSNMFGGSELFSFIDSVVSKSPYYGITANAIGPINDAVTSIMNLMNNGVKEKELINLATSTGMIVGIPVSQMKKWVEMFVGWAKDIQDGGELYSNITSGGSSVKTTSEKMVKKYLSGDMDDYRKIRESLKDENASTVKTNITSYLREQYVDGKIDDGEVRRVLTYVYGMSDTNINKKLEEFRQRKNGTYQTKESKKWGEE